MDDAQLEFSELTKTLAHQTDNTNNQPQRKIDCNM
jgi:hypothetical protein